MFKMKIQLASLPKQPYCVVGALEDVEFNVGPARDKVTFNSAYYLKMTGSTM